MCGIQPILVDVEVDVNNQGLPYTKIIGLPGKVVQESRDRIKSALKNSGFTLRARKTTINLSPISLPKEHATVDLAIAVGILQSYGKLLKWEHMACFGEIALDGSLRSVKGGYALAKLLIEHNITSLIFPKDQEQELTFCLPSSIKFFPVKNIAEVCNCFFKKIPSAISKPRQIAEIKIPTTLLQNPFLLHILEICISGGHHALFAGPLGTGKTTLAQTAKFLLPRLSSQERKEVAYQCSLAGKSSFAELGNRPFCEIHPHIPVTDLIGSSAKKIVGKIVLANTGILFADELPLFDQHIQEHMLSILDHQQIQLTTMVGLFELPSCFTLIATANLCNCGFLESKRKRCACSQAEIERYQRKMLPALVDRIPIKVGINEIEQEIQPQKEDACSMKERIITARNIQGKRYGKILLNGQASPQVFLSQCSFSTEARMFMQKASLQYRFSKRKTMQIMQVAQTIADLSFSQQTQIPHIAEAIQLNKELW